MVSVPVVATDLRGSSGPGAPPGTGPFHSLASRKFPAAEFVWLIFVIVQVLDGVLSYVGVSMHGPGIEGNPLVAWYLGALGPAAGFMVAKLFAVTCGAVLYATARHRWVAALTVLYIVFAVGPWAALLTSGS